MSEINTDLTRLESKVSILPDGNRTTSTNGANSLDCQNYESIVAQFVFGTVTDGSYTLTVEESDTGTGSWTTAVLSATPAVVTTGSQTVHVGVRNTKRYLRAVVTAAGTTTGAKYGANILGRKVRF